MILAFDISPTLKITKTYTIDDGLLNNEIRAIYNDPNSSIWIGSGSGAAWLEDYQFKVDSREINPVVNGVSTIYKDSKSNIWFGGLNEFHSYKEGLYKTYSIVDDLGLNGRVVFSFHEDSNQNLWVGTTGGASVFDGENWQSFTTTNGLKHNVIHDINEDKNGNIWFATRKGGINIFDGTNWKYVYTDKNARKILRDFENNMWVGTSEGLLKFDGNSWQIFEEGKTVLPMFRGKKGYIWCIANGIDIIRISPEGESILYENPTMDEAKEIYVLEYSHDGSVWAGTDHGIFVFH
jgi:ligand-binding sensor domain-containing protein